MGHGYRSNWGMLEPPVCGSVHRPEPDFSGEPKKGRIWGTEPGAGSLALHYKTLTLCLRWNNPLVLNNVYCLFRIVFSLFAGGSGPRRQHWLK